MARSRARIFIDKLRELNDAPPATTVNAFTDISDVPAVIPDKVFKSNVEGSGYEWVDFPETGTPVIDGSTLTSSDGESAYPSGTSLAHATDGSWPGGGGTLSTFKANADTMTQILTPLELGYPLIRKWDTSTLNMDDDFEAAGIDTSKWKSYGDASVIEGGMLKFVAVGSNTFLESNYYFSGNFSFEFYYDHVRSTGVYFRIAPVAARGNGSWLYTGGYPPTALYANNYVDLYPMGPSATPVIRIGGTPYTSRWFKYERTNGVITISTKVAEEDTYWVVKNWAGWSSSNEQNSDMFLQVKPIDANRIGYFDNFRVLSGQVTSFDATAAHWNPWLAASTDVHESTYDHTAFITDISTKEDSLGTPDTDGKVLSSLADGTRSWVDFPVADTHIIDGSTLTSSDGESAYPDGISITDVAEGSFPGSGQGTLVTAKASATRMVQQFQAKGSTGIYFRKWDDTAIDISTDFSGPDRELDASFWGVTGSPHPTIVNEELRCIAPAGGSSRANSVFSISGDFDLEFDLGMFASSGRGGLCLVTQAALSDSNYSSATNKPFRATSGGWADIGVFVGAAGPAWANPVETISYIRFTRTGSTGYMYTKATAEGAWGSPTSSAVATDDLFLSLYVESTNVGMQGRYIFDNLVVNSGNIIFPTTANWGAWIDADNSTKEDSLGTPDTDGKVLSSLADGTRSWVDFPDVGNRRVSARIEITSAKAMTAWGWQLVTFHAAQFDDYGNLWSDADPTKLVIPPGYNRANLYWTASHNSAATSALNTALRLNGTQILRHSHMHTGPWTAVTGSSGPRQVTPGDFFELELEMSAALTVDECTFSIDIW